MNSVRENESKQERQQQRSLLGPCHWQDLSARLAWCWVQKLANGQGEELVGKDRLELEPDRETEAVWK